MKKTLALLVLFLSLSALADEVSGKAALNSAASVKKPEYSLVGKGIRKKKIAIFSVKVYEAEFFVSNLSLFKKEKVKPLEALAKMEGASIQLTFLRNLSSDQVRDSFSDALKANHVDPASPQMKEFFAQVVATEKFPEGKSVTLSADVAKGVLTYVDVNGKMNEIHADQKFVIDLFSIWLGVPVDGGLADLKEALLGG